MAVKKLTAKSYAEIIDASLSGVEKMTWEEISAAVTAVAPVPKGGWGTVRSGLQMLLNAGLCARLPGVHVEAYHPL